MSSVIALDFGNQNCVGALPRRGGVDIALNGASQRLTPTLAAYDETRRYSGETALTQQNMNIKNTISQVKRLVGLKYDSPEREAIEKLMTCKLVKLDDGYVGIEVEYRNETTVLRVEQVLALIFFHNFRQWSPSSKDCVIVVSPSWNECQRRVILDAAKIAGYKILKLVNSTTAAAITYSMYHRKILPEKAEDSKPVCFIDFGDATLNVAVAQLYQGSVEVKGFSCDDHLGGANFTQVLVDFLLEETKKKYKIDPSTNARAMLRFRTAAEKCKKALSVGPVVQFDVQNLMNDVDVCFMVKREDYESRITDLVNRIEAPITKALELANVKKEDLFAIEAHGGASRVAAVKAKIKEIFGKDPTQSLNPDECFAMGGGFQAAILSPQFKVDLNLKDVSPYAVKVDYTSESGEAKTAVLFKQFNVCPATKTVPVKLENGKGQLRLYTDDSELGKVEINCKDLTQKSARVQIRLNPDGVIEVQRCFFTVIEEVEVIEKPEPKKEAPKPEPKKEEAAKPAEGEKKEEAEPKKEEEKAEEKKEESAKPAEEEKKEEPKAEEKKEEEPKKKIVQKKREFEIDFQYNHTFGLSDETIQKFQKLETEMRKNDEAEHAIDHAKNDLESYIYSMQSALTRDYVEYFDPAKIEEYKAKTDEIFCWFSENEFDRLPLADYQTKLAELKKFGAPATDRRVKRQQVPNIIAEQKQKAASLRLRLDTKEDNFKHIGEDLRAPVRKEIDDFSAWLDSRQAEVDKTPKHLNAPFTELECNNKYAILEQSVQKVLCTPKPKPEPKKEEPKAEGEKKDEEPKPEGEKKEEEAKTEEKKEEEAKPAATGPKESDVD